MSVTLLSTSFLGILSGLVIEVGCFSVCFPVILHKTRF